MVVGLLMCGSHPSTMSGVNTITNKIDLHTSIPFFFYLRLAGFGCVERSNRVRYNKMKEKEIDDQRSRQKETNCDMLE